MTGLLVQTTVKASGDVGILTREQKEAQGLVPAPINLPGFKPLRWAEFRLIAEAGRCENDPAWGCVPLRRRPTQASGGSRSRCSTGEI